MNPADINWHSFFFLFFSLLTCGFALAVLFTSNIVRMAFYLTLSLGAASGLFFLAGAEFVGAMQFMIYVGGTLVLLIFGVMLTAQQRFISMETQASEWILAAIVGSALLLLLVNTGFSNKDWNQGRDKTEITLASSKTSTPIGLALSGVRVDRLQETNPTLNRGMSGYLLPFVIVSMHLLVVLIGAGYMARSKRRATGIMPRTGATVRTPRPHSIAVMGGIVSGVIMNLVLAGVCLSGVLRKPTLGGEGAVGAVFKAVAALPGWVLPVLGMLFLVNVLLLVVVYSQQKWGAIGLVVVPVIQTLALINGGVAIWIAAVFLLLALGPAAMLIGLLTSGRPYSAWSQME